MDGILLANKPKGPTSHDIIFDIRRKFGIKKTGHTGTLDPLAEGLMIILVGQATKISPYMHFSKEYEIGVLFGKSTETDDLEGTQVRECPVPKRLKEKAAEILPEFTGVLRQTPPVFSAVKKDGKKLYNLARRGKEVNAEPRSVEIFNIDITGVEGNTVFLRVHASAGTYMRSIARDMGERLGSCAVLSQIKRTRIGGFCLKDAKRPEELTDIKENLISIDSALYNMPGIEINENDEKKIRNGMSVALPLPGNSNIVKLVRNGKVIAIGEVKGAEILVKRGIELF
ncbi:MAG TPA: tRNA pseudouridine(55) synthase TruB [Firmicutes bacterium]|nr:tRNA pseudouridine(55) synthase TruB [Bacillota bacterium]